MTMLLEMLISIICMPPYINIQVSGSTPQGHLQYELDSIIAPVSFFKIYHIEKLYKNYTIWFSSSILNFLTKENLKMSFNFSMRADLKLRPLLIIVPVATVSVFLFGYIIRNMERGYTSNGWNADFFQYATNGWWNAIITMTTVGYGDVYPKTDTGRFMTCIVAILGLILISLYVASLNSAVLMNKQEFRSYYEIKQFKNSNYIKSQASNIIKYSLYFHKSICEKNLKKIFINGISLKNLKLNKKVQDVTIKKYVGPEEILQEIESKVDKDMEFIKNQIEGINGIKQRIGRIKIEQDVIEKHLNDVLLQQSCIVDMLLTTDLSNEFKA